MRPTPSSESNRDKGGCVVRAGDVFRFAGGADDHFWLIISDPSLDPLNVLVVNITTWRADKEQTCLVNPGDHPAIRHNSCVYYRGSRVHSDAHLNHLFNANRMVLHEHPASPELLARVREGAVASKMMRLDHGAILINLGLVDP